MCFDHYKHKSAQCGRVFQDSPEFESPIYYTPYCSITLGKLLKLSELQSPHLPNGEDYNGSLIVSLVQMKWNTAYEVYDVIYTLSNSFLMIIQGRFFPDWCSLPGAWGNIKSSWKCHFPQNTKCVCVCLVKKLCPSLCEPMDGSPPGFSVHEIFQARILEWVAISYSKGSSRPRGQTWVSCISCIGRRILYSCTIWEALLEHYIPEGITIPTSRWKWERSSLVSVKHTPRSVLLPLCALRILSRSSKVALDQSFPRWLRPLWVGWEGQARMALMVDFITEHLGLYLKLCGYYQPQWESATPKPILQMRRPSTQRRTTLPKVLQLSRGRADSQTWEGLNLKDTFSNPNKNASTRSQ